MPYQCKHGWKYLGYGDGKTFYWCKSCGSVKVENVFGKISYRLSNVYKSQLPKVADGTPSKEEK